MTNSISLPESIQQQLDTIHLFQCHSFKLIAAILLTIYSFNVQKQQLLCQIASEESCECLPDVFPIRWVSSLIILMSLTFFYNQSKQNASQPQSNCISSCSSGLNHTASIFALLAAAIRFFDLNFVELFTPAESASV